MINMEFETLLKTRHSAVNFEKDFKMQESDFEKIINLTKLAPSAYNLQPTNYLVVLDQELKEQVYNASYKQHKIHTASAVVFVLGNKDAISVESAKNIYGPMKMLKIIDEVEYSSILEMINNFSSPLKEEAGEVNLSRELVLAGSISAAFFMMSAQNLGFNTCPMHIVDKESIIRLLNIPENMEPILMITIGKSVDKTRQRGYRKMHGEMLRFNKY